jgi:hypothetical protein
MATIDKIVIGLYRLPYTDRQKSPLICFLFATFVCGTEMEIFRFLFLPMTVSGRRGGWRGQIEGEKRREETNLSKSFDSSRLYNVCTLSLGTTKRK